MMNNAVAESKWREVWTRKGGEVDSHDLESLMKADGFDAGTGCISVADWLVSAEDIAARLRLRDSANVLEVGCGAGAMLWPLRKLGIRLYGVDYSATLTATAKAAIPELTVSTAEACQLPFEDGMFEAVFSHGVFFYFADLGYAQRALDEIWRVLDKSCGRALILDVPDQAKMERCEGFRRDVVYQGQDYPTGQDSPYRHLYFAKQWFEESAARRGMKCTVYDQDLPSYPMSPFRFNALLEL